MAQQHLIGPFAQMLTFDQLSHRGAIAPGDFPVLKDAAIAVDGEHIVAIGNLQDLHKSYPKAKHHDGFSDSVAMPGLIDSHTHMCFSGSRAADFADRLAGVSYTEIAKRGGGILSTVSKIRATEFSALKSQLVHFCDERLKLGITTCEVKSGYGLDLESEIKMLEVIQEANEDSQLDLIPTCLAAHTLPPEFTVKSDYLDHVANVILPAVKSKSLASRCDIYIDDSGFSVPDSEKFLKKARDLGFDLVIHADQFATGGADLAAKLSALSADHLEHSTESTLRQLIASNVICTALPGASLGLGEPFPKARFILNSGGTLVIASDFNPGSAPMGNLLLQASVLGVHEKLSMPEILSAITNRAALALKLSDRGILAKGKLADIIVFPCSDYREIVYQQGRLQPHTVFKRGIQVL